MLNNIVLMGRLIKDPEKRYTQSGKPVTSFCVACERDFLKGEKETDFFDVVTWGRTADFVEKYFSKGRTIIVSGRLQKRNWTGRDGNSHSTTEIIADNVYFGENKKAENTQAPPNSYDRFGNYTQSENQSAFFDMSEAEENLPF